MAQLERSGLWVGMQNPRHIEGVYLTLCLRRTESCKIHNPVLNLATVDAPGVIISIPLRPYRYGLYPYGRSVSCLYGSYGGSISHIGVGSDVVCSTGLGNARALVRGTGNKKFPRFFYAFLPHNFNLPKWGLWEI